VTIRNCRILTGGDWWAIGIRGSDGTTITRNEIHPLPGQERLAVAIKDVGGNATNTTVTGNDISHMGTGIQTHEGLIQDNYIHDFGFIAGDHLNGTTDNGGSNLSLTIRHNTILNNHDQTDAISLFQDFGVQTNKVIDNNLVAGGSYTIYGGEGRFGKSSNIKITNNRFSRMYFPNSGVFGTVAHYDPSGPGNVFTGNIWDDTGLLVTP
jgi:hypothetical protein